MRALLVHYQQDKKTYEINDQFMFGENMMIAPVLEQGKKARMVYLPKGHRWIDYWTKEVLEGGRYVVKETPLDICPIYVKEGSIIPNYPEMNYIGEKEVNVLKLDIYLSKENSEYIHYQDNGENFDYRDGKYNLYNFSLDYNNSLNLKSTIKYKGYDKTYSGYEILFNGIEASCVYVNEKEVEFENFDGSTILKVKDLECNIRIK